MTETYNKNGKKIYEAEKNEYPFFHKTETGEYYKTFLTNNFKLCTVKATEQEIKLIKIYETNI